MTNAYTLFCFLHKQSSLKSKIIIAIFLIIHLCSCNQSSNSKSINNTDILIHENGNCILKTPSQISKLNDSIFYIVDRFQLFELNIRNGDLKEVNISSVENELYSHINSFDGVKNKFVSYDEIIELGIEQDIHLIYIDEDTNHMLFNMLLFFKESEESLIAMPVNFWKKGSEINILFMNDSAFSNRIPLCNIPVFYSGQFLYSPVINYFPKDSVPGEVPSLSSYEKGENGDYYLNKAYSFPFLDEDNVLLADDEHDDLPHMSKFNFSIYQNRLFVSPGTSLYMLDSNEFVKVLNTENRIASFAISNDTISTLEKNSKKEYSLHIYDFSSKEELPALNSLPTTGKIYGSTFIDNSLFFIYRMNDNFYFTKI